VPASPLSLLSSTAVLALCGSVCALVVLAAVARDAHERRLSGSSYLGLAAVAGAASFGGFLLPVVYERELSHLYFHVLKPSPVVVSPSEWLAARAAVGATLSVAVYLTYLAGVSVAAPAPGEER